MAGPTKSRQHRAPLKPASPKPWKWDEAREAVEGRAPGAWREIGDHLAQWEAEHRTEAEAAADRERDEQGRFIQVGVSHPDGEPRDHMAAQGNLRRMQI